MKESDLFPPVKAWLESNGYQVYSEVSPQRLSTRADVVGITPQLTVVVELKQTLSLDLIEQAIDWIPHANYIYVAVPKRKNELKRIVAQLLRQYGIGLLEVDLASGEIYSRSWRHAERPRLNRRISTSIKASLTDYHLTHSPDGGHAGGGYITPYRITMLKVKELLGAIGRRRRGYGWERPRFLTNDDGYPIDFAGDFPDGWIDMKTILMYCETHYASPRASLSNALQSFETDWCEVKKEAGKLWFRLREEEPF
jgi:hypothetical protein